MKNITETLVVFCVTTAAVCFIHHNQLRGSSVLIPALWGLGALLPKGRGELLVSVLGLTRLRLASALKHYLVSTLIVFPVFGGGFFLYHRLGMPLAKLDIASGVSMTEWIIYQFAFVGVFEELFFRGYIQRQFERIACGILSGRRGTFWLPIVSSAFLFGVAHVVVKLDPITFGVFFSGVLFAWLRAKTGSLLAPILSHGSANVFSMFLIRSVS